MSNQAELDLVRKALQSGLGGCVEWHPSVADRVEAELARHGLALRAVRKDVIQYVRTGGAVFQVKEERDPWKYRRDYWYKIVVPMPELFLNGLFVELELYDSDPELPEIRLLNAHEQH